MAIYNKINFKYSYNSYRRIKKDMLYFYLQNWNILIQYYLNYDDFKLLTFGWTDSNFLLDGWDNKSCQTKQKGICVEQ